MNVTTTVKIRKQRRYPILVVEQNPDQWLILRSAMAECFPEVEPLWKNHPIQALTYLEAIPLNSFAIPRLIFIDPFLPEQQDGWAFLTQLKANPRFKKIPVIILSHSDMPEDVLQAYALGAAGYVTKPTNYLKWVHCFHALKRYWWELAKLPISA